MSLETLDQKVRRNQLKCSELGKLDQRHGGVLAAELLGKVRIVLELAWPQVKMTRLGVQRSGGVGYLGPICADAPSRASDWGQKWEFQGSIWWSDSGCSAWFTVRLQSAI